jgi:hypothetical protein
MRWLSLLLMLAMTACSSTEEDLAAIREASRASCEPIRKHSELEYEKCYREEYRWRVDGLVRAIQGGPSPIVCQRIGNTTICN